MNGSGLSYMLANPADLGLAIRAPLCLLLLVMVVFVLWKPGRKAALAAAALRAAAIASLALAMSRPALTSSLPSQRMTLIAAVDLSESIGDEGRAWARRFVNRIAAALAPGDELGIVTFAAEPRVARAPGIPAPVSRLPLPPGRAATDVERGLETALALLPPETTHRILLISDGNETRGNAIAKAAHARRLKAAIYAAVPPRPASDDVLVDKVVVPPVVTQDYVFPLRALVHNSGKARQATLRLILDETPIGEEKVALVPGRNAIEIPYRLAEPGSHSLRVQIDADNDHVAGNNYRIVPVTVAGPPHVLVLSANRYSPLAEALRRRNIAVEIKPPQEFPTDATAALKYHCVIAEALTARDLSAEAVQALERYVGELGGGLVFVGGRATFGDPRFRKTALKRLLPVTLEPQLRRPRRIPLSLMVLIDRSNSMGYGGLVGADRPAAQRDPATSKLHYAKAAALAVVGQLKNSDSAGVLAFDSRSFVVAPLKPLRENRSRLEALIPLLVEGGGTDFYDALDSARRQLAQSHGTRRHIILLTDGDTNRSPEDHYPLIRELASAGISVATVRVGDDAANLKLLRDISALTGGHFYHVKNVELLPRILLRDAARVTSPAVARRKKLHPHPATRSPLLRGIPEPLPPLHGYALAQPKRGADVVLELPRRKASHPLLAAWQYGLGRAVAFTADPQADASPWLDWPAYGKFWSQITRWAMRAQRPSDYAIEARRHDGKTTLSIRAFGPDYDDVLSARLYGPGDHRQDVTLVPIAPRLFTAQLRSRISGRYPVTILRSGREGAVAQQTESVFFPRQEEEPQEEFGALDPNLELMRRLAEATGGSVDPAVRELAARGSGSRQIRYELDSLLVPLAMVLFLGDVAIRRLWILPGDRDSRRIPASSPG